MKMGKFFWGEGQVHGWKYTNFLGREGQVHGRKYTPLYEKDIKKTENKRMETNRHDLLNNFEFIVNCIFKTDQDTISNSLF